MNNDPTVLDESAAERIAVDFNEDGTLSGIVLDGEHESMGDVQAGIEFIYHMREHLLDVGIATVYLISVYAFVLWIKKKLT